MLSPYTVWEARIINKASRYSFKDLEKFKNLTNLELAGFGSYVETNEFGIPTSNSGARGVNQCRSSKFRLARSVKDFFLVDDYITNDAPKGMSSPFNFICNFLKTYLVTNAIASIFVEKQKPLRNCDDCSEFRNDCTETKNIDPLVTSNLTVEIDATSAGIEPKSDNILRVNFNGNNSSSKSFLLSDQMERSSDHYNQVPDLNCSLLLADLVTRTVTGNRYKSPTAKCLLSPRELVLEKINDGPVQRENDVKQMLQVQLSEKDGRHSSWLSKINNYAKSMFQYLGLMRNEDTEVYVQDVWHLFA
ncbi:unnamed protein product [Larinioides sclopetarius]|uniref:Uncharacterized protein n=1 Tax=Larinioides sclopetarius TaxID=280406 RepID=A0AAV2ATD5_9ARAC